MMTVPDEMRARIADTVASVHCDVWWEEWDEEPRRVVDTVLAALNESGCVVVPGHRLDLYVEGYGTLRELIEDEDWQGDLNVE